MRHGVVAAVKGFLVRLLFAVIGKRLAGDLPPGEPASIGERGEKDCVHRAFALKDVERLLGAFIHERYRADLEADHLGGRRIFRGAAWLWKKSRRDQRGGGQARAPVEKLSARETI